MNKGKYPLQFWIDEQLKLRADKVKERTNKSHKDLYEDGIIKNEKEDK